MIAWPLPDLVAALLAAAVAAIVGGMALRVGRTNRAAAGGLVFAAMLALLVAVERGREHVTAWWFAVPTAQFVKAAGDPPVPTFAAEPPMPSAALQHVPRDRAELDALLRGACLLIDGSRTGLPNRLSRTVLVVLFPTGVRGELRVRLIRLEADGAATPLGEPIAGPLDDAIESRPGGALVELPLELPEGIRPDERTAVEIELAVPEIGVARRVVPLLDVGAGGLP